LGVDDVIRIVVAGRPELGVEVVVEADGRVRLPELGAVAANERTTAELANELSRRYNILHPTVSEALVSVLQYNSRTITVVGEVRTPGSLGFRVIPDLVQVLLKAGGPTPLADLSNVRVVRREHGEGEPKVVSVNLSDELVDADPATLPTLRPHDTIVIPTAEAQTVTGETFQVLGSVAKPGVYSFREGTTVVKALTVAGGPAGGASLKRVNLTRETEAGVVAYRLDVQRHLAEGRPGAEFEIRPGDTIMVPAKSTFWSSMFRGFLAIAPVVTAISTVTIAVTR